jgi:hypothetical protein
MCTRVATTAMNHVSREDNMEEVRRLNELILAAKCSTILDNQVSTPDTEQKTDRQGQRREEADGDRYSGTDR